ncbi:MAG: bifunctional folylpolyglutamate synthase/dihydrofolate synthase [Eubacterium sp.]
MTYSEAISLIAKKQSLGIMPGLERIGTLLNAMGNPQNSLKIIHIAGTNGKGTVCNLIAKALCDLGYSVGLFTSPWITDYREQIQINGEPISEENFAYYVDKYKDNNCSEFELLTAIMYKYFYDKGVDWAVVECGMGGLEDSTNAIPSPELAVITSVSMDHTAFLGDTLEKIAFQKAGIIKENTKVVLYPNPKTQKVFIDACSKTNSQLFCVDDTGNFCLNNIETAKTALSALNLKTDINPISLPARQEYIGDNIMLDGAHNPDGAKALVKNLPKRKITAVIGMMRDKDIQSYLNIVAPYCSKIIITTPSNPRSVSAQDLMMIAKKYCPDVTAVENPSDAVKISDYDFLLICGSFYLARDVRKELL